MSDDDGAEEGVAEEDENADGSKKGKRKKSKKSDKDVINPRIAKRGWISWLASKSVILIDNFRKSCFGGYRAKREYS